MNTPASFPGSLAFGRFRVLVGRRELRADGVRIKLSSRAFDILMCLIEGRGALVSKDELMRGVWGGTIVAENTVQSHIHALRKALGRERDLILTVPGQGYRFVGQLQELQQRELPAEKAVDPKRRSYSRGGASSDPPQTLTNLPSVVSPLIGRSAELAELSALISRRRLVTLTGPGGVGKSRLALELAHRLLPHFPDGVWVTELAPLSDPKLIGAAVVATLGLQIRAPELSGTRLAAALASKQMLLVLDNCEHVVDAAASFVEDLLRAASALQIVTTSREPLGAEGEQVYQIAPLVCPPEQVSSVEEVLAYEAAHLILPSGAQPPANLGDWTHSVRAAYETPCRCAGVQLSADFHFLGGSLLGGPTIRFLLDLKSLGSFGTF